MAWVYLLGDWEKDNYYKIGVTRGDIDKRIKKLQTGNGGEIYVVNSYECDKVFLMEKMLHVRFGHKKVLGEWFELEPDEVINFKDTCRDIEDTIKSLEDNKYFNKKKK